MSRVQNRVKVTCKDYTNYRFQWPTDVDPATTNRNNVKFTSDFDMGNFLTRRAEQFYKNLQEYQWVKFNYLAIKVKELNYMGFQYLSTDPPGAVGVTAWQANRFPMYFAWDVDQEMTFGDPKEYRVDPMSLTMYPGTKSITPASKRPISFLWKVPRPWRQFYSCNKVLDILNGTNVPKVQPFFEALTGILNLRCPSKLLGTHVNWWGSDTLPNTNNYVPAVTQIALMWYAGVTFYGRRVTGMVPELAPTVVEVDVSDPAVVSDEEPIVSSTDDDQLVD